MSVNIDTVEENIVSELRLTPIQTRVYVLVVKKGKMSAKDIAQTEFESMHPRFAVVNMYRRMCERENIPFKKNLLVDNISIVLEKPYDDARTKYNR